MAEDWFAANAPAAAAPPPADSGDWFAKNSPQAAPAPAPQRGVMDEVGDFVGGAAKHLNPVAMLQGAAQAVAHPIDTAGAMLGEQGRVYEKAKQAFGKGDYIEGVRHILGFLLPMLGPAIDEAGDKAQSGRLAEGLGEAAGLGLQPKMPGAVAKAAGAAARAAPAAAEAAIVHSVAKAAGVPAVVVREARAVAGERLRDFAASGKARPSAKAPVATPEPVAPPPVVAAEPPVAEPPAPVAKPTPAPAAEPAPVPPTPPAEPWRPTHDPAAGLDPAIFEAKRAAREAGARPSRKKPEPVAAKPKPASDPPPAASFEAHGRDAKASKFADVFKEHGIAADDVPLIADEHWSKLSKSMGIAEPPSAATRARVQELVANPKSPLAAKPAKPPAAVEPEGFEELLQQSILAAQRLKRGPGTVLERMQPTAKVEQRPVLDHLREQPAKSDNIKMKQVRATRIDQESPGYAWDQSGWKFSEKWAPPRAQAGQKVKQLPDSGYYTVAPADRTTTGVEQVAPGRFEYMDDGFTVGVLKLNDKGYITDIAVPPPFQGKGIGTKLLRAAKEAGVKIENMSGTVSVSDAGAALLRKFGVDVGSSGK